MTESRNEVQRLDAARRVIRVEGEAILGLTERLTVDFARAVDHLLHLNGRAIVCGMGKSGLIGRKIAATLMSTGTPSYFLHPAEAYHGDLGMIAPGDMVIAISHSGETEEVVKLLPFLTSNGNALLAITGNPQSTLATSARYHLDVSVSEEACPLQLAPTSSTTAALTMGDALAVALMEERGFSSADFARFHPGGALGRRLLGRVEDEMIRSPLPEIHPTSDFVEIVQTITRSNLGLAVVSNPDGWGIITDGDLRRAVETHGRAVFDRVAHELQTISPASVAVGTRTEDALAKMDRLSISALLVFEGNSLLGVLKK